MASIYEIINLAVREITIDVRGVKITLVEKLMQDPEAGKRERERVTTVLASTQAAIRKVRSVNEEDSFDALEASIELKQLEQSADPRSVLCDQISARVASWDLTDDKEVPLPLDPKGLYDGPVPDDAMREILTAIDKEPLVPNGNASR